MKLLKELEEHAQNLYWAVNRYNELIEKQSSEAAGMLEMVIQFGGMVAEDLKSAGVPARIDPAQVEADNNFTGILEVALKGFRTELELIERELIDQALIDAREGGKGNRYIALEKRERDLKQAIKEAEEKLGKVAERVASPAFSRQVNQIVNGAKV
jgi:vacuolar-type H+-ATPase subunit E/Vma4